MKLALQRAVHLVFAPGEAWIEIRDEVSTAGAILVKFVFPLACIPAAAWSLGLMAFGGRVDGDRESIAPGLEAVLRGGLTVFSCSVLSIFALASSVWLLAALFDCRRDWRRAFQVAAYSGSPVFLGGIILVVPDLAFALLLAGLHALYLLYGGLRIVLGVREERAAEYVALATVMLSISSTVMGAIGAALGAL